MRYRIKKTNSQYRKENEDMRRLIVYVAKRVGFDEPPSFDALLARIDSLVALAHAYQQAVNAAESAPADEPMMNAADSLKALSDITEATCGKSPWLSGESAPAGNGNGLA